MSTTMKLGNVVMLILFAFWIYFQHNDPDGPFWMAIYSVAVLSSVLALLNRLPTTAALLFGAAYLGVAVYMAIDLALTGEFAYAFGHFLEDRPGEPARELLGLAIAGAWIGFLGLYVRRHRPKAAA